MIYKKKTMACIKAISIFSPPSLPCARKYVDKQCTSIFFGGGEIIDIPKIAKGVGINQRYVVTENQTAADMACEAANKLFEEWNVDRKFIDFIIFST